MIGRLKGILLEKQPPEILLDVQGVGYELLLPMTSFYDLPEIGQETGDRPFSGQLASGFAALRTRERPPLRHDFHKKGQLRHRQNSGQPVHPKAGAGGEDTGRKGQHSCPAAAL